MKNLIKMFLALLLFSSCSDITIVDIARAIPKSNSSNSGSNLNENPAFQSELNWYNPFNVDSSSYNSRSKLYTATDGVIVSIPVNERIMHGYKMHGYFTHNGQRHNEFEELNERLRGYRLNNVSNFLRNEFKEEVQFSNEEEIVALNLKTKQVRTIARIENNSCDQVVDWSDNNYLYVRNISSSTNPDTSILYRSAIGDNTSLAILSLKDKRINQAFQVDPNTYVVEIRQGSSSQMHTNLAVVDINGVEIVDISVPNYGRLVPKLFENRYMVYVARDTAIKFDVYTGEKLFEWEINSSFGPEQFLIELDAILIRNNTEIIKLDISKETKWTRSFHDRIGGIALSNDKVIFNFKNKVIILNKLGQTNFEEESPYLKDQYDINFYGYSPILIEEEIYNIDDRAVMKITIF